MSLDDLRAKQEKIRRIMQLNAAAEAVLTELRSVFEATELTRIERALVAAMQQHRVEISWIRKSAAFVSITAPFTERRAEFEWAMIATCQPSTANSERPTIALSRERDGYPLYLTAAVEGRIDRELPIRVGQCGLLWRGPGDTDRVIEAIVTCIEGKRPSSDYQMTYTYEHDEWTQGRGGAGCFVATAAFGDSGAEELRLLRLFRDQVLERNRLGRAFVFCYNQYSPAIASFISGRERLRKALRIMLRLISAGLAGVFRL